MSKPGPFSYSGLGTRLCVASLSEHAVALSQAIGNLNRGQKDNIAIAGFHTMSMKWVCHIIPCVVSQYPGLSLYFGCSMLYAIHVPQEYSETSPFCTPFGPNICQ